VEIQGAVVCRNGMGNPEAKGAGRPPSSPSLVAYVSKGAPERDCPGRKPPFLAVEHPARPQKKNPYKTDLLWKTLRAPNRPWRGRTEEPSRTGWAREPFLRGGCGIGARTQNIAAYMGSPYITARL
jgi:hypothetical protein